MRSLVDRAPGRPDRRPATVVAVSGRSAAFDRDRQRWRGELVAGQVESVADDSRPVRGRDEVDLPHLVVTHDPVTGIVSYSGPFASSADALAMCESERRALRPDEDLTFTVAPLYPPTHPG